MKNILFLLLTVSTCLFACKSSKTSSTSTTTTSTTTTTTTTTTTDDCIDESKIDPNGICNKMYRPVCGCNGETYGNSCMADKAGVTSWVDGKCQN